MTIRVGSLFAGIGGFDIAFERAGFEIAWQVEWDEACRRTLRRRFSDAVGSTTAAGSRRRGDGADVASERREGTRYADDRNGPEIFGDVRAVGAGSLSGVDVLVGGWPCQPVSVAGRRRASSDERDMWPEFRRLAGELRPAWVVGENVPGVLTAEGGSYWRGVVDDLTQLGYSVGWRTLDAQYFGVPQRRRRVFVVGHLGNLERVAEILFESEGGGGDPSSRGASRAIAAGELARSVGSVGGGQDFGANKGTLVGPLLHGSGGSRSTDLNQPLVAGALNTKSRNGADVETFVTHTLSSEGSDASEDGTGRGTPLVTYRKAQEAHDPDDCERWEADDITDTLDAGGHTARTATAIAFSVYPEGGQGADLRATEIDTANTVTASDGAKQLDRGTRVDDASAMLVRRLTPTECERLQGFPDGWTEGESDSTRYRQLGNAVAVPVVEWIARRLMAEIERGES